MSVSVRLGLLLSGMLALASCRQPDQAEMPLPAEISREGNNFVINNAQLRMVLTPDVAGRVSSLQIAGHEILMGVEDKHRRWGNILWTSPQTEWGWPPPPVLDSEPYETEIDEDSVTFTSQIDPHTGYQFSKRYRSFEDGVRITYTIENQSKQRKVVAPLELTRVPARGDIIFPMGDTPPVSGIFYPLKVNVEQGLCWFHYDAAQMTNGDHYKITMDGAEGWLAYRYGNVILVKVFRDVPSQDIIDGEQEIELFAHSDKTFLEIKHQGARRQLSVGKSFNWSVTWKGYELPEHLRHAVAPEELADFVRKQLIKHH